MAGLGVYRAFSRVFPRSFRAKLMAVMVGCTVAPLAALVVWLMTHNGAAPERLLAGSIVALGATLVGGVVAMVLVYQLLSPLRLMAEVVHDYYREHRLPNLPEVGGDEVGMLMRGINCGLREIDSGMRELERVALEDPLTGALSRRGTDRALQASVERAERLHAERGHAEREHAGREHAGREHAERILTDREQAGSFMLYVIDVDNLKPVNDELGHAAGDALLVDLVTSARGWLDGDGWIGRWGGDEFLVGVHAEHTAATQAVHRWLRRLAIADRDGVPIRVSVGCAHFRPGLDALQLYREADAAMYKAKARGGGALVCDDGGHAELARSA